MGLDNLDPAKKQQEDGITEQLFSYIDQKQSLVFNAGAGAGKTYALIQSLNHVMQKCGKRLEENNQQIMCITYTNVAAKHIKEKLGNSKLVTVSTIHERLWQVIAPYQEQLLPIHKEKIESEIQKDEAFLIEKSAKDGKAFKIYCELSKEERQKFEEAVWEHKDDFYRGYGLNAKSFKNFYKQFVPEYDQLLNSAEIFKKIVLKIYAIRQNRECLTKMGLKEQGYKRVEYNARYNQDRLYKMRISHDTLLEYSRKLVTQYPTLQQIIIDKYPYIFIDEYQDTAEDVVEIMAALEKRGKEIGHTAFIGYYGDPIQSIYEYGVGGRILEKHSNLKEINKTFNRRSYAEIINVANRIRLDGLLQESIFADCKGGKVEFCFEDNVDAVIERCRNEWKNEKDPQIHCFMLKNEEVAKRTGISSIYNIFKGAKAYSGSNYKQLNTELLSNDLEKLGRAAAFLYRILKLYMDVQEEETPVEEILYGDIIKYNDLNIQTLKGIKHQLRKIKGNTLDEIVKKMCECYDKGDIDVKMIIEAVLDIEKVAYSYIIAYLVQALDSNRSQADEEEQNIEESDLSRVTQLLAIDVKEYEKWYDYIGRKNHGEVVYHTYHGTKGLEFENVLIVVEDGFGNSAGDRVFIKRFLEDYDTLGKGTLTGNYEKARNLFYVAVTRAIKNLKVIYEGESEGVRKTLNAVFNIEKQDKSIVSNRNL